MGARPTREELHGALSAAGRAHHEFETTFLGGQYDEAWPGWYAAYVLGRCGDFVPPSRLATWLRDTPNEGSWAENAASYVLEQLSGD